MVLHNMLLHHRLQIINQQFCCFVCFPMSHISSSDSLLKTYHTIPCRSQSSEWWLQISRCSLCLSIFSTATSAHSYRYGKMSAESTSGWCAIIGQNTKWLILCQLWINTIIYHLICVHTIPYHSIPYHAIHRPAVKRDFNFTSSSNFSWWHKSRTP